jgi:hypothetical protein
VGDAVFIFHGRDDAAYGSVADFLLRLGLRPKNFRHTVTAMHGVSTLDVIEQNLDAAKAIILLLTPDEYTALDPGLVLPADGDDEKRGWSPRPNVLFEVGFAFGRARTKTILTQFRYPGRESTVLSNIAGHNIITLNDPGADNKPSGARQLVRALRNLVDIGQDATEFLLDSPGLDPPRSPDSMATVKWPDPYRAPPPPWVLPSALVAAVALGLVGGHVLTPGHPALVEPAPPCPSATTMNITPPASAPEVAKPLGSEPISPTHDAGAEAHDAGAEAAYGELKRELAGSVSQLADCRSQLQKCKSDANVTVTHCPDLSALCPANQACERHSDNQCCPLADNILDPTVQKKCMKEN